MSSPSAIASRTQIATLIEAAAGLAPLLTIRTTCDLCARAYATPSTRPEEALIFGLDPLGLRFTHECSHQLKFETDANIQFTPGAKSTTAQLRVIARLDDFDDEIDFANEMLVLKPFDDPKVGKRETEGLLIVDNLKREPNHACAATAEK